MTRRCVVEVDSTLCKGCGICTELCPRRALTLGPTTSSGYPTPVLQGECVGCRTCENYCPDFAISVRCEE